MKAIELKAKLIGDLGAKESAIQALHKERLALVLPANSGDAEAGLRLADLRADVERLKAEVKDLEQALVDVERLIAAEVAEATWQARQRLLKQFGTACEGADVKLKALDVALVALLEAYRAAEEATKPLQALAVELLVPMVEGSNVTAVVQSRMCALATVRLDGLRGLVEAELARGMSGRPLLGLAAIFSETERVTDRRLREVMAQDRSRAQAAGVLSAGEAA